MQTTEAVQLDESLDFEYTPTCQGREVGGVPCQRVAEWLGIAECGRSLYACERHRAYTEGRLPEYPNPNPCWNCGADLRTHARWEPCRG